MSVRISQNIFLSESGKTNWAGRLHICPSINIHRVSHSCGEDNSTQLHYTRPSHVLHCTITCTRIVHCAVQVHCSLLCTSTLYTALFLYDRHSTAHCTIYIIALSCITFLAAQIFCLPHSASIHCVYCSVLKNILLSYLNFEGKNHYFQKQIVLHYKAFHYCMFFFHISAQCSAIFIFVYIALYFNALHFKTMNALHFWLKQYISA